MIDKRDSESVYASSLVVLVHPVLDAPVVKLLVVLHDGPSAAGGGRGVAAGAAGVIVAAAAVHRHSDHSQSAISHFTSCSLALTIDSSQVDKSC